MPNLVWLRPTLNHPLHPSNPENIPDPPNDFLQIIHEIFSDQDIPSVHKNYKYSDKSLQVMKKHFKAAKHSLPLLIVEESPSVIWTTIVVTIIHGLFDFFR